MGGSVSEQPDVISFLSGLGADACFTFIKTLNCKWCLLIGRKEIELLIWFRKRKQGILHIV